MNKLQVLALAFSIVVYCNVAYSASHNNNPAIHLALTKICISEAGFKVDRFNDCRLIYEVLKSRSERLGKGRRLNLGVMRAYSKSVFNKARTDVRRWIPFLNHIDIAALSHDRATWEKTRRNYFVVYAYTAKLITNEGQNIQYPCSLPAHHWGKKRWHRKYAIRRGWRPITCDETLNRFWNVPSFNTPNELKSCLPVQESNQ